jgi:starch-binding outer membrane protein, SusD/RagB family
MKSIISGILLIAFSLVTISCEKDFLETFPTDAVGAGDAYSTTVKANTALNGMYRTLIVRYQGLQTMFGHPATMIVMDAMGEDLVLGTTSNGGHRGEMQWVTHRNDQAGLNLAVWQVYYRVIANANLMIANIDNASGAQADKDRYKAEALALRAWCYFNLVQLYGKRYDATVTPNSQLGIPMPLVQSTEGLARSTVEQVYTQINSDLDDAITLFATASVRPNKSHINIAVAKGIKARVALVQQNWAMAETLASEAITASTGLSLMTNSAYQAGFSDIGNSEWMWGWDHALDDQSEFFGSFHSYMSCNYNSTNIRTTPKSINRVLYDLLPSTDVRSTVWHKVTSASTIVPVDANGVQIGTKVPYHNQKFRLPGVPSTTSQGDVPYMRLAEMYLIQAEAESRQNKDAEAVATLDLLAKNRNPSYTTSVNTGAALLDEILLQRRWEMWGEGHRFLDLKRMNLPLLRVAGTGAGGQGHIASNILITSIPAGDVRWEWLIPRTELNANKNVVQNPLN